MKGSGMSEFVRFLKIISAVAVLCSFCPRASYGREVEFESYAPSPRPNSKVAERLEESIRVGLAKAERLYADKKFEEAVWEYERFGFLKGEEVEFGFGAEEIHHFLLTLLVVSDIDNQDKPLPRQGMNRIFRPMQEFQRICEHIEKRETDAFNRGLMILPSISVMRAKEHLSIMKGKAENDLNRDYKALATERPLATDGTSIYPSWALLSYADFAVRNGKYRKDFLNMVCDMLAKPVEKNQKTSAFRLAHIVLLNRWVQIQITPCELIIPLKAKYDEEKDIAVTRRIALILGELHRCEAMRWYFRLREGVNEDVQDDAMDLLNVRYWQSGDSEREMLYVDSQKNAELGQTTTRGAARALLEKLSDKAIGDSPMIDTTSAKGIPPTEPAD